MADKYVVIVAGGKGTRMGGDLPKQYIQLHDKPVLMHSIDQFAHSKSQPRIIVVLHEDMLDYWQHLCRQYNYKTKHEVVIGGTSRFQSVKNGLSYIFDNYPTADLIAIHDGARPIISTSLIDEAYIQTKQYGATVLAIPSTNSIRQGAPHKNSALDRSLLWQIQTPQTFKTTLLKEAFQQEESPLFTDDASVVEAHGHTIHLIPGDYRNIKITYPEDLQIAQIYIQANWD